MTEQPQPDPEPKPAGRQQNWPTLWHKDQIPLPWGSATRQHGRPDPQEQMPPADPPEPAA